MGQKEKTQNRIGFGVDFIVGVVGQQKDKNKKLGSFVIVVGGGLVN